MSKTIWYVVGNGRIIGTGDYDEMIRLRDTRRFEHLYGHYEAYTWDTMYGDTPRLIKHTILRINLCGHCEWYCPICHYPNVESDFTNKVYCPRCHLDFWTLTQDQNECCPFGQMISHEQPSCIVCTYKHICKDSARGCVPDGKESYPIDLPNHSPIVPELFCHGYLYPVYLGDDLAHLLGGNYMGGEYDEMFKQYKENMQCR